MLDHGSCQTSAVAVVKSSARVGAALFALASATAAWGQVEPAQPAAEEANTGEIIVTAQRREQSVQDVPIAVSVFSGETLTKSGVQGTEALTQITPGLTFTRTAYFAQPYIRGVGSSSTAVGDESSVATYIDGVYQSALSSGFLDFLNVERVEVLKGPQGTLFGRNATGGAISVTTLAPTDQFEARFRGTYGRFNEYQAQAFVNGGIAPGLAVNLAGSVSGRDSFTTLTTLNKKGDPRRNYAIRGRVQWTPTDNLTFDLIGGYTRSRSSEGLTNFVINRNSIGEPLGFNTAPRGLGSALQGLDPFFVTKETSVSLQTTLELEPFTIVSVSGYHKHKLNSAVDSDGLPPVLVHFRQNDFASDIQQDLRVQSNADSAVTWLVGAFYFNSRSGYDPLLVQGQLIPGVPAVIDIQLDSRQTTEAFAVYADVTVPLGEKLELTGGFRYSAEEKRLRQTGSLAAFGLVGVPSGLQQVNFDDLSPRAVLSYKPNEDILLYASYSKGFKSGGFNQSSLTFLFSGGLVRDPAYDPESINAYEIGTKTSFDTSFGSGTLNISAFHYDYSDLQVQLVDPTSGTARIQNAARARMNGIDAEATLRFGNTLRLRAGVSYLDAKYRRYNALVTVPRPRFGTGTINDCAVALPAGVGCGNFNATIDVSGRQMVKAPKWTLTGGIDHTLNLGGDYRLESNANLFYTRSYPWEPSGRFRQKAHTVINLQTELRFPGDQFSVGAYLRNVTDSRGFLNGLSSTTNDVAQYIDPRSYGVIVTAKF